MLNQWKSNQGARYPIDLRFCTGMLRTLLILSSILLKKKKLVKWWHHTCFRFRATLGVLLPVSMLSSLSNGGNSIPVSLSGQPLQAYLLNHVLLNQNIIIKTRQVAATYLFPFPGNSWRAVTRFHAIFFVTIFSILIIRVAAAVLKHWSYTTPDIFLLILKK